VQQNKSLHIWSIKGGAFLAESQIQAGAYQFKSERKPILGKENGEY
jgi:hypothetical protein